MRKRRLLLLIVFLGLSLVSLNEQVLAQEDNSLLSDLEPITAENIDRIVRLDVECTGWIFSSSGLLVDYIDADAEQVSVGLCDITRGTESTLIGREMIGYPYHIGFSPDGTVLIVVGDGTTGLWNTTTGELLPELEEYKDFGLGKVTFSPDSHILAAVRRVTSPVVQFWNVVTGKRLAVWELESTDENNDPDNSSDFWAEDVVFSPDGAFLAVLVNSFVESNRRVELWDVSTGEKLTVLPGAWYSVAFDASGTLLTGDHDGITFWSVDSTGTTRTVEYLNDLKGHPGSSIRFDSEEAKLASAICSGRDRTCTVGLWNLATGELLHVWETAWWSTFVSASVFGFGADGSILITGNVIWDVTTGEQLVVLEEASFGMTLSPDGKLLAVMTEDGIQMWGVPADE